MMLTEITDKIAFRQANQQTWESCWRYWLDQEYVHHGIRESLEIELRLIKEERGSLNIIDLGCGSAWVAKYFQGIYDQYLGIDFNPKLIEHLNGIYSKFPNINFQLHDLEDSLTFLPTGKAYDVVVASFILLEVADLDNIFKKIAEVQTAGDHFIIYGLEPLNELIRTASSLTEMYSDLSFYRLANAPVVLTKSMSFNNQESAFYYYRVLYSVHDVITSASRFGYQVVHIDDQINRHSSDVLAPIYYSIKMVKR